MKKVFLGVLGTLTIIFSTAKSIQLTYDPTHDPWKDFSIAQAEAKQRNINILVDVGGDWCIDCRHLDEYYNLTPKIKNYMMKNYILMKVYEGDEKDNSSFISQLPHTGWVPSLYIISSTGRILASIDTRKLSKGSTFDTVKMESFLNKWTIKK